MCALKRTAANFAIDN